ncbi:hypothetical protein MPDQ_006346, partial [Monascus purpureus]
SSNGPHLNTEEVQQDLAPSSSRISSPDKPPVTSESEKNTSHLADKATMPASPGSETPKPAAGDAVVDQKKKDTFSKEDAQNGSIGERKRKLADDEAVSEQKSAPDRAVSKRKRQEERHQRLKRRGKEAPSAYSRRDRSESREATASDSRQERPS